MGIGTDLINRRNQRVQNKAREARNAKIREAMADPRANTAIKEVLGEAIDNTSLYNKIYELGRPTDQAPGSASTQIKISGPSQAEQVAAGLSNSPRVQLSAADQIKFGDKDMRSQIAEEKLQIAANHLSSKGIEGPYSRDDLVTYLNTEYRAGNPDDDLFNSIISDDKINAIYQAGQSGQFDRPAQEVDGFVGEGQFGRVVEIAPGYVEKRQAPLVEWGGYSDTDPNRGESFGRIFDYRDVADEVGQMNDLSKMHMGPKVEAFNINPDGSTEVVMRDLRNNFTDGLEYLESNADAKDFLKNRLFQVKRMQQEAASANAGLKLGDRHEHNVMANNMTGRPLQIDPTGREVAGIEKDIEVAILVEDGFRAAGLEDEADIFAGLFNEAQDRRDVSGIHDIAKGGLSRLQKIKSIPQNYTKIL